MNPPVIIKNGYLPLSSNPNFFWITLKIKLKKFTFSLHTENIVIKVMEYMSCKFEKRELKKKKTKQIKLHG